jgi:hypothetical protein
VIVGTVHSFGAYLIQYRKLRAYLRHEGSNMGGGGATATLQLNVWLKDIRQNTVMSKTALFCEFHSSPHCNRIVSTGIPWYAVQE